MRLKKLGQLTVTKKTQQASGIQETTDGTHRLDFRQPTPEFTDLIAA